MAFARRDVKREIPPAPDPRQLSLFGPNTDQILHRVDPKSAGRRQRGTIFPVRGGCPLFCTCDPCLNGRP